MDGIKWKTKVGGELLTLGGGVQPLDGSALARIRIMRKTFQMH